MSSKKTGPAPRYHWIRLRSVAHATEDVERVRAAVQFVSGLDAKEFGESCKTTGLESHHGGDLQVVECLVDRSRAVRDLLQRLMDLPGGRDGLLATLEARTDDDGVFYARVDKQKAFQGALELTSGEDCVQVRLRMETYPADRESAVAAVRAVLEAGKT
jgi:RNA-binding protein